MDSIQSFFSSTELNVYVVYFLLVASVIVFIATMMRHLIGIKIMSLSSLFMFVYLFAFLIKDHTSVSIIAGVILICLIYFFSYYSKTIAKSLGLHYLSRVSFVISLVSMILVLIMIALTNVPEIEHYAKLTMFDPFAVLMALALSDSFASHQTQKGIKNSRRLFLNTLLIAIPTALLVSWFEFQKIVIEYPYIILAFVALTLLIGRYTGMRLNEVFRFRDVANSEADND